MGLFGLFKDKKKDTDPMAGGGRVANKGGSSPWPDRFKGFRDWEDDRKRAVGKELLSDVGTRLTNAKVKDMIDEDDLELRGRFEDIPVRLKYELDMGWVNLEMKCKSPIVDLELEWDLEKIPVASAGNDDDWDDDDEIRVFVGKGVFMEGGKDEVEKNLAILSAMPAEISDKIVSTIEGLRLTRFYIFSESIDVGFDDNSYEMVDPVSVIAEAIAVMAGVAKTVGTVELPQPGAVATGAGLIVPVKLVSCTYCSSKFNVGTKSRCPNCGGSFEG